MYGRIKGKPPQQRPKRSHKEIAFVFFLAAILLLLFISKDIFYGSLSSRWPTTNGIVDAHDITTASKRRGGKEYYTFRANIYYNYMVDGQNYRNHRVTFPYFVEDSQEALQPYFAAYPIGTQVTVYYNPLHPETAILTPVKLGLSEFASIGVVIFFFIIGFLLLRKS